MRIRKLAKLSSLLNATSSSQHSVPVLQAHVCHFNQSPWDVMTNFSPPSSPPHPPPPPPPSQVNGNGSSAMNESSGASISVMEWEEYDDDVTGQEFDCMDGGDDTAEEKSDSEPVVLCCKTDGRSWQCRREASIGNSLCEHHLSIARKNSNHSHIAQSGHNKKKSAAMAATEGAKRRVRPKKPPTSSSNPSEFYYYSGLGPRWGKKRGEDKDNECDYVSTISLERERVTEPDKFIDEGLDYIDDDDDDEEEEGFHRKRARKPVKARSLKSLM